MTELLRPGALRIPDLEGKSLVVVGEDDSLGAIGEIGDRRRGDPGRPPVSRRRRQCGRRSRSHRWHSPRPGDRLPPRGVATRAPGRPAHAGGVSPHGSPRRTRRVRAFPDVFRSLLNMLAVLRARINAVSHRTSRLRLPALRRISPLDDAPLSQGLDLLVIVPELPQQGPGVLADLGGGLIASGR